MPKPDPSAVLKERLLERWRQWEEFNRWEAEQPPRERPAGEVLADLSAIRGWLPAEVRSRDPDPEKLGVQKMRAVLARLGRRG